MGQTEALRMAESGDDLAAILIGGMHAVVSRKSAERAEARGTAFSWIMNHHGRVVTIPNHNEGK